MEYKLIEAPEVKMSGDGAGFIEGYASTFANFDSVRERVVKGAFAQTIGEFLRDGFIAVGHDWSALPIATPVDAIEDEHGLKVIGEFHTTEDAQKARTVIRERLDRGKSVKLSIGYEVLSDEFTQDGRLLKQLKLFEWSYVTVPANPQASVTNAKHFQRMTLEDHAQAVLATNTGFAERMKGIRELLVKEGRQISAARRARLEAQLAALAAIQEDIQALLAETEPKPKADPKAIQREFLRFQQLLAQRNGVQAP